ncbi:MAG TPA: metallopeptidase family protein [Dehalococcoidia bacterium]|nr:metallopeptidase family protein [Dehalococcoidia bacterium]
MDIEEFHSLVTRAVAGLPEEFLSRLENVDVVVQDYPSREQMASGGLRRGYTLLGLYEGVPLTRRGRGYGMVLPDKITIFQKPIEARCRDEREVATEIRRVVRHEIAHHFGISDARLLEIERGED